MWLQVTVLINFFRKISCISFFSQFYYEGGGIILNIVLIIYIINYYNNFENFSYLLCLCQLYVIAYNRWI